MCRILIYINLVINIFCWMIQECNGNRAPLIVISNGGVNSWVLLHGILHHITPSNIAELERTRSVKKVHILYDERVNIPIGVPWHLVTNESEIPPEGNDYYDAIHQGLYPRSQSKEDIWIYENAFYKVRNGIILESGGFDGLMYSNSFFFEFYLNWKAIHIEADLINFKNLAKNRKNSTNINAALCQNETDVHFISKPNQGAVNGIYEFMTDDFKNSFHADIVKDPSLLDNYPHVMCKSPTQLFAMLGIRKGGFYDIDIWVLDVEGAELEVLKGTDFSLVNIKFITMECDGKGESEKDRAKIQVLAENSFICQVVDRNCMCSHKSFIPSKK